MHHKRLALQSPMLHVTTTTKAAILLFEVLLVSRTGSLSLPFSTTDCSEAAKHEQQQQQRRLVEQQLGYLPSNFVRVASFCQDGSPLVLQTYPLAGGSPRRQARSASLGRHSSRVEMNSNNGNKRKHHATPFPTLYWLCHPQINKCIADLERRGCMAEFQSTLDNNPPLHRAWLQAHHHYAKERWDSLSVADQKRMLARAAVNGCSSPSDGVLDDVNDGYRSSSSQSKLSILRYSGIAGSILYRSLPGGTAMMTTTTTMVVPSIKCLHAHYAHYRAATSSSPPGVDNNKTPGRDSCTTTSSNPVGTMVHERLRSEFPDLIL